MEVSFSRCLSEINHKERAADTSQYVQVKVDSPCVKVTVGFVFFVIMMCLLLEISTPNRLPSGRKSHPLML